jgi:hypothetical protein
MSVLVNPPKPGDESYEQYHKERTAELASLRRYEGRERTRSDTNTRCQQADLAGCTCIDQVDRDVAG